MMEQAEQTEQVQQADKADRIERAGPVRRGLVVWFAVFGGVAAWTIHLIYMASLVRYTCNQPDKRWTLHAGTVICALITVAAMALAARLHHVAKGGDEGSDRPVGRLEFLALVGLAVGGINLLLILVEGAYAGVLHSCG